MVNNRSVEWNGRQWCLIEWEVVDFLTRRGTIMFRLRSRLREDAETEARLQGWF
jgi:hypothetical protein